MRILRLAVGCEPRPAGLPLFQVPGSYFRLSFSSSLLAIDSGPPFELRISLSEECIKFLRFPADKDGDIRDTPMLERLGAHVISYLTGALQ